MGKPIDELSIFFPAYNLESQIVDTIEAAFRFIPKIVTRYEVIVINDGSYDGTAQKLLVLKKKYPELKIITHKVNLGYGAALKSGLYSAKYDWIAFTDGDGQFDIQELPKFINKQQESGADLVIGYYLKRQVAFSKIITSKFWEFFVHFLFGLRVKDIDCGYKLISKEVINSIPKLESKRGAFISSEFLIKAKKAGFKITEVGVTHYPRKEGKGTGRDIKVILNSFVDLFRLWRKLK